MYAGVSLRGSFPFSADFDGSSSSQRLLLACSAGVWGRDVESARRERCIFKRVPTYQIIHDEASSQSSNISSPLCERDNISRRGLLSLADAAQKKKRNFVAGRSSNTPMRKRMPDGITVCRMCWLVQRTRLCGGASLSSSNEVFHTYTHRAQKCLQISSQFSIACDHLANWKASHLPAA